MDNLFPANKTGVTPPRQHEFGRRSLEYTVVSKRKLRRLIQEGLVKGWDDPRMPTLSGQRRRGVTPEAIRAFAAQVSVSRTNRTMDIAVFDNAVADDLNLRAPRVMAVANPLRVTIQNLDGERVLSLPYWPHDVVRESPDGLVALPTGERVQPEKAVREVPLTREVVIECEDFSANPPKGFKRLAPGGTVRLRGAGIGRCDEVVLGNDGEVRELRVTLLGEEAKAAGVIHWVSATRGLATELRLFDRLFTVADPEGEPTQVDPEQPGHEDESPPLDTDFLRFVNPRSLVAARGLVEPSVARDPADTRYQFERQGYFWRDPVDSRPDALVFNRISALKDSWSKRPEAEAPAKAEKKPEKKSGKAPADVAATRTSLTVLTAEQQEAFERLRAKGVSENDANLLARDAQLAAYLHGAPDAQLAALAPWVVNDLATPIREGTNRVARESLAALATLLAGGSISGRIAKDVLAQAQASGGRRSLLADRRAPGASGGARRGQAARGRAGRAGREPRQGGGVPRGQEGADGLLHRAGDARDRGAGGRADGDAAAHAASGVTRRDARSSRRFVSRGVDLRGDEPFLGACRSVPVCVTGGPRFLIHCSWHGCSGQPGALKATAAHNKTRVRPPTLMTRCRVMQSAAVTED